MLSREEAKQLFQRKFTRSDKLAEFDNAGISTIDAIYDGLESRTCENCKYFNPQGNLCESSWWGNNDLSNDTFKVRSDFSCKEWEQKNVK